jgi:hypothetical protein
VDAADIDGVLKTGPVDPTKLGSGPRILSIIHSPHDTMDEARVEDVAKGIRVLEQLIRTLDASDH